MFYELASSTWDKEELRAIQSVVDNDRFTMGPKVKAFEQRFAEKMGSRYAIMVSSGSAANLVGIAALFYRKNNPLKPGDEVIVPAISWATTYYPLQQYGLKLRFVDVELDTLNMDVSKLKAALTPKTRMVMAVSILGNPCALDTLRNFCNQHNLILFEDNCESMGATLNGKPCGTFGDLGTFSSFFSHHISTMEGGVIVTNDEELYHLCISLRAHGWTRDLPENSPIFEQKPTDLFETYRFILPGYNARPLEMSGAIGIEQLKKLDRFIEIRRKNAEHFLKLFKDDDRFIIQRENGCSSWFAFTIILNPKYAIKRNPIFLALRDADIGHRLITGGNFLRHDVIRYFNYDCVGEIVHANIAHDQGFFVGNHPYDIKQKITVFHQVLTSTVEQLMRGETCLTIS